MRSPGVSLQVTGFGSRVVFFGMSSSGDSGGSDEGLMECCYVVVNGTEFLEVL